MTVGGLLRALFHPAAWLRALVGSRQRILVENNGKGHSDGFAPVALAGGQRGEILDVRVTGVDGDHLVGVRA